MHTRTLVVTVTVLLLGCARASGPAALVDEGGRHPLPPHWREGFVPMDVAVGGVRLVGVKLPAQASPGGRIEGTLLWQVDKDCAGTKPRVFVHASAEDAELNLAQGDHQPVQGAMAASAWRPGDVLVDVFTVPVPAHISVDELVLLTGLYEGNGDAGRWPVTGSPEVTDGKNRVRIGRVHVDGAPPLKKSADIPKRRGAITIDGVLDEADWQGAVHLEPFALYDGKGLPTRGTQARMLWDDGALYLAFEAEDPDPFTPYQKRDDPLYDSEALEIFIDADGDGDVYVELQAAPNDLQFDAAFAGGRRKHMEVSWNAAYQTATRVAGTTLTQEWRIDVASLRDIPAGEPRAGAVWHVNLFRLERIRDDAHTKVVKNEASAWSPPLSGDFHNIARMGTITFR